MGELRRGIWRRVAYLPRLIRHYWHRRRSGQAPRGEAFRGALHRMRDYR